MSKLIIIICLVALPVFYICFEALSRKFATSLIFPHVPASYSNSPDLIHIYSKNQNIIAIYLKNPKTNKLLLYSHGNGEDIGKILPRLEEYVEAGYSVLAYDYPGYGLSTGKTSEEGCYTAIEATYKYAIETLHYTPDQILLYGRSLGGGPSCWLAAQNPVAGVILESTFTSTFRVMTRRKIVPWDIFDNYNKIDQINAPILIIHGEADEIVPHSHAVQNFKKAREPKYLLSVPEAKHNNLIEVAGTTYWEAIAKFNKTLKTP